MMEHLKLPLAATKFVYWPARTMCKSAGVVDRSLVRSFVRPLTDWLARGLLTHSSRRRRRRRRWFVRSPVPRQLAQVR